ncbi:MAG: YHS domain protein [Flavobacteriales bacterium]|nr:YHS domain protein [Flavobacteriales bacterium]
MAYLVQGRAVKGSASIVTVHRGATFHFAIAAHRDLFLKDPERYLPEYGGWCAYAMGARNEKVEVDPETFKVKDGRVYLFYNAYFSNTLTAWNKNEALLQAAADRNWTAFKHK